MKPVTKKQAVKIRSGFHKPTKAHSVKKDYNRKKEKDWKKWM